MEKSTNRDFNLPNSNNDEVADINLISDNFRIIDNVMVDKGQAYQQAFKCVEDNSFESITDEMGNGDIYGIPIPSAVVKYVKGKDALTE